MILLAAAAFAGPAHVEKAHARKEARTIELLQRSTARPGVPEQAVARYLDRWGHVDASAVERIERWGASLRPPAPEILPEERPLAIPATAP